MSKFITKNQGLLIFSTLFILLSLLYPIHFISDDWEELDAFYSGIQRLHHDNFMRRFPIAVLLLHLTFFKIFANELFFLGKFIFWGCQIAAYALVLSIFVDNFWQKLRSQAGYALLLIVISFSPNNYEWNMWPTNISLFPMLLLMALSFKFYTLNIRSPLYWLIKTIVYIAAFTTSESLIPMFILLECAFHIYKIDSSWPQKIKALAIQTIPPIIIILILKIFFLTVSVDISNRGFKPHLFSQLLSLTFFHDYYKALFATGSLSLLSIIMLIFCRVKNDLKTFLTKDLILFILYLLGTSYYYYLMDYSSRRALAGPLYFFWGWTTISFLYLTINKTKYVPRLAPKVAITLFLLSFSIHTIYVAKIKYSNKQAIATNVAAIKQRIHTEKQLPIIISPGDIKKGFFKRGWNLVNNTQFNGFLRHYLTKEELKKIKLFP